MDIAIRCSPKRITRVLFIISIALILASMAVSCWVKYGNGDDYWFITRIFDFDVKNNLPHAFKGILLFFCSVCLFWISAERKASGGVALRHWRGLAWIFLALSIDQEIQIHQQLVAPLMARCRGIDPETTPNAKVYWLVPYLIFAAGFVAVYFMFWWRLPARVRFLFAAGGVVYIMGVAVLEHAANSYARSHPDPDMIYIATTNVSEWLQMAGSIIFLRALMEFNSTNLSSTSIVCESDTGNSGVG